MDKPICDGVQSCYYCYLFETLEPVLELIFETNFANFRTRRIKIENVLTI